MVNKHCKVKKQTHYYLLLNSLVVLSTIQNKESHWIYMDKITLNVTYKYTWENLVPNHFGVHFILK